MPVEAASKEVVEHFGDVFQTCLASEGRLVQHVLQGLKDTSKDTTMLPSRTMLYRLQGPCKFRMQTSVEAERFPWKMVRNMWRRHMSLGSDTYKTSLELQVRTMARPWRDPGIFS